MAFGDFTVVRSTVKNVLNSSGVLASVAVNTPAFEFNTDGSYKGLLVEPGATNLATYSQAFDDASWVKNDVTVSANAITAPDGTMTADKVIPSIANTTKIIGKQLITVASAIHTNSLYIKAGGYSFCKLSDATTGAAIVNLTTGSIVSTDVGFTATIEDALDGWWRVTLTYNATTSRGIGVDILLDASTPSFAGDGTSGIYLWQAQLETGTVATSPIPTVASTVARTADDISLTSASSLIGQTEGTVYIESETRIGGSGQRLFEINDATSDNRITCIVESNFTISTVVTVGGVGTASYTGATESNTIKVALAYANNDIATYVNAVANGTDTSSAIPATSVVYLGSTLTAAHLNGWIKSFALFPTRLANATLASLTTL
jgi:hypothetical protein